MDKEGGFKESKENTVRPIILPVLEDILQETFINVFRFSDSFKGESRIFTWLYRIATNECTKHFTDADCYPASHA